MDWERIEQGTARTAAQLRIQLAQMTAASQLLERCAWDEKSKGYLAALNQGICRMLRIVGRLEITGRLGGKDPRLERAPADLGRLTQELGERLAGLLECAEVKLEVSAPEGLWAWVDVELIRQVTDMITCQRALQSCASVTKMYDEVMGHAASDIGRM